MVVYTGLLKLLDDETQLANVLSHEAAHVVARHAVRRNDGGVGAGGQHACLYSSLGSLFAAGIQQAATHMPCGGLRIC